MLLESFASFTKYWPQSFFLVSPDGVILAANQAGGKLAGRDSQSLVGQKLAGLVTEPADKVERYLKVCSRSREPLPGSLTWSQADGKTIPCQALGNLIVCDHNGQAFTGIFLQCTPKAHLISRFLLLNKSLRQLQAQETQLRQDIALRAKAEAKFRNIYQASPTGIELYDPAGLLLDANRACLDIFGVTDVSAVRGFKLLEDPNLTAALKEHLRRGENIRFETQFDFDKVKAQNLYETTKSGVIYLDILITTFHDVLLESGIGFLVHVRDITERKRAEDALRKREQELNESQRLAHIGSWDWDAITDKIQWSPEYYRIYDLDPNLPTPNYLEHLKVYTPKSANELDKVVQRAMRTGESYTIELELARPDEVRHWIFAWGEAKRDANGKIVGLRGSAQNITERKIAEQAIATLARFPNENPNPVQRINRAGVILFCNSACASLLGEDGCQPGQTVSAAKLRLYQDVLKAGVPRQVEEVHGERVFSFTITPIPEFDCVNVYGHDITTRKRAEKELRWHALRMEYLLGLARLQGRSLKEIATYALESCVNLTNSEVGFFHFYDEQKQEITLNAWSKEVYPQCALNQDQHYPLEKAGIWADCIRKRQPVLCNDYQNETSRKGYPQGHFPVRNFISIPIFEQDKIVMICGVGNKPTPYNQADIDEITLFMSNAWSVIKKLWAEQEIKDTKQFFESILENTKDGIWVTDQDDVIIYANKAMQALFGLPLTQIIGARVLVDFPETTLLNFKPCYLEAKAKLQPLFYDSISVITPAGRPSYQSGWLVPRFKDGKYDGMISTILDVTERVKAAQALKQAKDDLERQNLELKKLDTLKDNLIRDMTHELKTPVAKQLMQVNLLERFLTKCDLAARTESKNILQTMRAAIKRQESVIENVLDLSRLEAGKMKFKREAVRLDLVIAEVVKDYEPILEKYEIKVTTSMEPLALLADGPMLFHVFSNLINNAIKYRRAMGENSLQIIGQKSPDKVLVRVSDQGIGMSVEEIERAFDKFYQASASAEGSGVGLTLTRVMVEEMGGHIWLESAGKDQGTTVYVELPANSTT